MAFCKGLTVLERIRLGKDKEKMTKMTMRIYLVLKKRLIIFLL